MDPKDNHKTIMLKKYFLYLFVFLTLVSCQTDNVYEGVVDITKNEWYINKSMNYTFEIKDETKPYDVFLLLRNTMNYPYYNLYFKYELTNEKGQQLRSKLEQVVLFNEKTGKPLGDGLGDIFDHKYKFSTLSNLKFPAKGKYKLKLIQYMRQDPLKGVVSVGISVEKPVKK